MITLIFIIIITYYFIKKFKENNENAMNKSKKDNNLYNEIKTKKTQIQEYIENNLYNSTNIEYYKKQPNNQPQKEPYKNYNYINKKTYENKLSNNTNTQTEKYKNYYKPKRYITTLNELKFYNVLLEIAKELDLILFAQVSLYSIISMNDNLNNSDKQTYFNKIASKSIDFVMVDKQDCRVKLCIELDDSTHLQNKRKERDKFINDLFRELEIPLLRYPCYNIYYKETLKNKVKENMKNTYYIN